MGKLLQWTDDGPVTVGRPGRGESEIIDGQRVSTDRVPICVIPDVRHRLDGGQKHVGNLMLTKNH